MKLAQCECGRCFEKWSQEPGPLACPHCGWNYVEWLNYEQDFARKKHERREEG
jgi:hypothetical protein